GVSDSGAIRSQSVPELKPDARERRKMKQFDRRQARRRRQKTHQNKRIVPRHSPRQGRDTRVTLMAFSPSVAAFTHDRAPGAGVTAVLGPTNTGKTHLAIE